MRLAEILATPTLVNFPPVMANSPGLLNNSGFSMSGSHIALAVSLLEISFNPEPPFFCQLLYA